MRLSTEAVHRDPKGEGNQFATGCTVGWVRVEYGSAGLWQPAAA
jgi:hypothetical protein